MVQGGKFKTKPSVNKKSSANTTQKLKKGARTIAPKQSSLIKSQTLKKKLSAKINRNIELDMAGKAIATGKLTIMKNIGKEGLKASEKKKLKKK
jgi:hypothetical protein